MEPFLLFLYTAIVSVLIALLLGKLFADDTADHDAVVSARGSSEVQNVSSVGGGEIEGSSAVAKEAMKDEAVVGREMEVEAVFRGEEKVAEEEVLREELFHLQKFSRDGVEKIVKDEAVVECEAKVEAVLRGEDRVAEDAVLREGLFHHREKFSSDRGEKVVKDEERGEKAEAVLHREEKVAEDVLREETFHHLKKFSTDAAEKVVKDEAVPVDVVVHHEVEVVKDEAAFGDELSRQLQRFGRNEAVPEVSHHEEEVVKDEDVLPDELFRNLHKFGRDQAEKVVTDEAIPKDAALQREVEVVRDDEAVVERVLMDDEERVVEGDKALGVVFDDKEEVVEDELTVDVAVSERSVEGDEKVKEEEFKGEGSLLQGEDGWEGIEKSEIEMLFGVAVEYVVGEKGANEVSKLSSDVQMKLYGLHKVATEGPCYESQPMALKVASRAKWNAWQRLGSMNPEAAMELYISLLSDGIPGWMRETRRANVDQKDGLDSLAVRFPGNEASDSRLSEDSSDVEGGIDHGTAGSKFKKGLTTALLFNLISPSRVALLTLW